MTIIDRVREALEHYSSVDVVINKQDGDGVVNIDTFNTQNVVYRYLTIAFGAERVSKKGGKVIVTQPPL